MKYEHWDKQLGMINGLLQVSNRDNISPLSW